MLPQVQQGRPVDEVLLVRDLAALDPVPGGGRDGVLQVGAGLLADRRPERGAVELSPRPGKPAERAYDAFVQCFEKGVLIRVTGDIIALSPPLIIEKSQIDEIFETLRGVLETLD